MALFSNKNSNRSTDTPPAGVVNRLRVFLDKLTAKADELYRETQENAQAVADEDADPYKRGFHQFKAGVIGQFQSLLRKADHIYQTEVLPKAGLFEQTEASLLFSRWHSNVLQQLTTAFDGVQLRDLEKEYREIMDDYNRVKERFHCQQCGGKLEINALYYISTYVECAHCKTQNTFHPGTKTRLLELICRDLAELRHRGLREAYRAEREAKGAKAALDSYTRYLRAVFDEMSRIQPGMEAEHEKFYRRLITDYQRFEYLQDI
ncbi:hypothetical protein [Parapedobacter lycopersici]|uniref:hypothetical protein n=1 Tax=Parapedobacter lycopersici TaxID=1864939 RepID=UPI0033407AA5